MATKNKEQGANEGDIDRTQESSDRQGAISVVRLLTNEFHQVIRLVVEAAVRVDAKANDVAERLRVMHPSTGWA